MIYIIDVSGKVPYYEHALCVELNKSLGKELCLITPYPQEIYSPTYRVKKLLRFCSNKRDRLPSIVKGVECLLNYIYLVIFLLFKRDVKALHFQWLPFLEHGSIEYLFIWAIRRIFKGKLILTVHNVFPHDIPEDKKKDYIKRFVQVTKFFDLFIVHNESSKSVLVNDFLIGGNRTSVIPHGVFVPDFTLKREYVSTKKRILMFGVQSYYKGTDIFIKSIEGLSEPSRSGVEVIIAGKTDFPLYEAYKDLADQLGIKWINRFIEEKELNQLILDSDLVVFPYREISQSGALLLSLYYKRDMILSDLPAFKETLKDLPDDCFFESGDVRILTSRIESYLAGEFNTELIQAVLNNLCEEYSWENSAKKTIELYN